MREPFLVALVTTRRDGTARGRRVQRLDVGTEAAVYATLTAVMPGGDDRGVTLLDGAAVPNDREEGVEE